jgi:hypothetical protein
MTDTIALATRKVNTRDEIELELIEAYQNYILTFYALKTQTQFSGLALNICDAALDTLHKLQIKYGVSTLVAPFSENTHVILARTVPHTKINSAGLFSDSELARPLFICI